MFNFFAGLIMHPHWMFPGRFSRFWTFPLKVVLKTSQTWLIESVQLNLNRNLLILIKICSRPLSLFRLEETSLKEIIFHLCLNWLLVFHNVDCWNFSTLILCSSPRSLIQFLCEQAPPGLTLSDCWNLF